MQKKLYQQQSEMGLAQSFHYGSNISQQKRLHQYILLTYRSGIIPTQSTTYYTSDSGWGCMLRVAQMFIANLIHSKQPQFSLQSVVKLFYDNLMVPFSIQNITKISKELFPHMKPYEWYTPCQAGFLVKQMLQKFDIRYKVRICNDGAMFLEDVKGQSQKQENKNQQNIKMQQNEQELKEFKQNKHQNDKFNEEKIVVLLMARIGLDHPEPSYLKCVTKFMQNKYFVSIMGGTPRHAHLILQYENGYFGYLDPHTTRSVNPDHAKVSQYIEEYRSKLLWMKQQKIDSSMCIGFCFLKSQTESFWESMIELKSQLKEQFFIYMDEKRPDFDENCIIEIQDFSDEQNEVYQNKQNKLQGKQSKLPSNQSKH